MPNAGMRALVPPITGEPSPHGLLGGCIPVVTATDLHHLNGTDLLPSSCATAHPWVDCPDPATGWVNPPAKIFDRPEQCSFDPVTAYAGFECSTVGMSFEEGRAAAMDQLVRGEQFTLEEHFMQRWLADLTHTTDLTPAAGAVHIVNGVGILESWLATTYGGQGILHAPIGTASLLSMHRTVDFASEETCPQTLAGNSVILGAGYAANVGPATPPAAPVPAPAGEAWLYMTPPMRIRRDSRQLVPQQRALSVNTSVNDQRALAETTFVAEVACCVAAAVRVSLSACC
ncbi:hypothetical protein SEA_XKCD426_15 [Streptomyces phage Xkcd426]|nr:hypothetical protein SEA_XKCD426_15 [Streptomyces phage Xkcd426]